MFSWSELSINVHACMHLSFGIHVCLAYPDILAADSRSFWLMEMVCSVINKSFNASTTDELKSSTGT
jgi:hypothetical protein